MSSSARPFAPSFDIRLHHARKSRLRAAVMLALAGAVADAAFAQPVEQTRAEPGAQSLDNVVVTAQRREQSLRDVPLSVTALDGESLERLGVQDAMDLVGRAPNFTVVDFGSSPSFTIRGIGAQDVSDGNESPVGVYVDDVYLGTRASQAIPMFDIERVEVLRGPQGTLFGRNTTGGLVHFITRKPDETTSGYAAVQLGSYGQRIVEGAVGGALGDTLRGRVSVQSNRDDGWQRNLAASSGRLGVTDSQAARLQLEWLPAEGLSFLLSANAVDQDNISPGYGYEGVLDASGNLCSPGVVASGACFDADGYGGFVSHPDEVRTEHAPGSLRNDLRFRELSLKTDWALSDRWNLVSLTSYASTRREMLEDSDATAVGVLGGYNLTGEFDVDARQYSQELRLDYQGERLDLTGGVYYYDDRKDPVRSGTVEFRGDGVDYGTEAAVRTRSLALFAQGDYALTPATTLTAGLRWTRDRKDLDVKTIASFTTGPVYTGSYAMDDSEVTGRLGLSRRFGEDWMLYGSIATGYKSPDFNTFDLDGNVAAAAPVEAEKVTAYEIGAKGRFADGRLSLTAALFYNDLSDKQGIVATSVTSSRLINYGDVVVKGAELGLESYLFDGLYLALNLGYEHSEISAPAGVSVTRDYTATAYALDGNQLPGTPMRTASAIARYTWWLGDAGNVSLQGDVRAQSATHLDIANSPYDRQGGYAVANARLTWRSADDRYLVEGFVENLNQTEYYNRQVVFSGFDWRWGIWGSRPRTWGVRFGVNF